MMNPDLIMLVESTPDTVIVMTDGTKYVVADSLADIYSKIVGYRADIMTAAHRAIKNKQN